MPDALHTGPLPTPDAVYSRSDPDYTPTLDLIMQYEDGSISAADALRLFARLIRTGQAWALQGHYGRTAADLIERGIITPEGRVTVLDGVTEVAGLSAPGFQEIEALITYILGGPDTRDLPFLEEVQAVVDEVAARMSFPGPFPTVGLMQGTDASAGAGINSETGLGEIGFTPALLRTLSLDGEEIRGVIAHELAHLVLDHPGSSHDNEYAADAMAAAYGYGPGLARGLEVLFVEPAAPDSPALLGGDTHPPVLDRIARLEVLG